MNTMRPVAAPDTMPYAPLEDIIGPGGVVVVAPHPDDETLGCGGLIAQACGRKRAVKVVIVSDGSLSHPNSVSHPPHLLAALRQQESLAALRILGVAEPDIVFLNIRDGSIPSSGHGLTAIARKILQIAQSAQASAILVTDRHDKHKDHRACYLIARQVLHWRPDLTLLEYAIWGDSPAADRDTASTAQGYCLDISSDQDRKRQAISQYKSQTSDLIDNSDRSICLSADFLERFSRPYEAFYGRVHEKNPYIIIERIHQIIITDDMGIDYELPDFIKSNTLSTTELYPAAQYHLWNAGSLRNFLSEHFAPDVVQAFDLLRPYAYKTDLACLCLLYVHGGLYIDLSIKSLRAMNVPHGVGIVAFQDSEFLSPSWTALGNGLIWAVPGRREFRIAIDYILENCRRRYYGANPLYPTGPVLFGRAMVAAMAEKRQQDDADDQWIGVSRAMTPNGARKNLTYITPDQSAVALLAKDIGGDLTHLGAVGTNNYNVLWKQRTVYGETVSLWLFDDPAIRLTEQAQRTGTAIVAQPGATGVLTFGPYIKLEPGSYRLAVQFEHSCILPPMKVEICCDVGRTMLCVHSITGEEERRQSQIEVTFDADHDLSDVEFRTVMDGAMPAGITQFSLERLGAYGHGKT